MKPEDVLKFSGLGLDHRMRYDEVLQVKNDREAKKKELREVLSSVECHEPRVDGFAVDGTCSDTDRVVYLGSRELRSHWSVKVKLVCTVMTFFGQVRAPSTTDSRFGLVNVLMTKDCWEGNVRYLTYL